MKIPDRIRFINKRFTNRLMGLIAGKKGSPVGLIRHTGRVSGKTYSTPILAAPVSDGYVFALTYGDHVDWYQNVIAARAAVLVVNGREIRLSTPQSMLAQKARDAFPQPFKTLLKWMGTEGFFLMNKEG